MTYDDCVQEIIPHNVKNLIRDNLKVVRSIDCTGDHPKIRRQLQHMVGIKPADRTIRSIYENVLEHALKSESICPTSGMIFLQKIAGCESEIKKTNKPKNKDEMLNCLRAIMPSDKAYGIIVEVLGLSTINTKISIKRTSRNQIFIDVFDGYSFDVKSLISVPNAVFEKTKIVCIDGYIESVSEIHHLLTHLSEHKAPCLLFARGASDDVLHTIKVNNDRKTLTVYPYCIPFDTHNVNTMVDIAVVSGTDVISSTKGQLISTFDVNQLGSIQGCNLSSRLVRIKNSSTRKRVFDHVSMLKNLREERKEIEDLISKRIKSLSSSCIDINIPNDIDFLSLSGQLDEGIRMITSILENKYDPFEIAQRHVEAYVKLMKDRSTDCLLWFEKD